MKIIDLLNKIANNEEVPEKIMFDEWLYIYNEREKTYYDEEDRTLWQSYNFKILTDEIEILEESKKIEKWGEGALEEMEKCTNYTLEDLQKYIRILAETQNELIDEINNLKGND